MVGTPPATPSTNPTAATVATPGTVPRVDPRAKFLKGANPAATARSQNDCESIVLVCKPSDRQTLKANNLKAYLLLQSKSQEGIKGEKFKFHNYLELSEAKEQGLNQVSSTLDKCKEFFRVIESRAIDSVFSVPSEMEQVGNEWVPKTSSKVVSLKTNQSDVDLDTVRKAVAWQKKYGPEHMVEDLAWSQETLLNSCDDDLRKKVQEDLDSFQKSQQGGPTAYKVMMKLVLSASEESMNALIEKFNNWKITDLDGENVGNAKTAINNIHTVLEDNGMLPKDWKNKVFDFFTHSTTQDFVDSVRQMKGYSKNGLKTYTVAEILDILELDYLSKLGSGKWVAKDTKQGKNSGFVILEDGTLIMCFNCGELGHMVKDCPHPIDEKAIAARKKLVFGSSNNGDNNRREKRSKWKPKDKKGENAKDTKFDNKSKNPKRQPPKSGESHEKDFDGTTLHWCGKCGRWGNHKTSDHKTKEELKQEQQESGDSNNQGSFASGATALNF